VPARRDPPSRVAVIGAGFIGTHVAGALLRAGFATTVITRSPPEDRKLGLLAGVRLAIADATSRDLLAPHLGDVDHVVYCASGLMPAESNRDPAADAHLSLPPLLNVLELLRRRPGTGLTFLSSGGTVYGPSQAELIGEDHPTEPITSYGIMKLAGEKYVRMYERLYRVPATVLRCANVYGEHQPAMRSQGVVAVAVDRAARGQPIPLYGDGSIVRDFVYVGDLAQLIIDSLGAADLPPVVNVGSGHGCSLGRLVELIAEALGRPVEVDRRPDRGFDVPRIVLDIAIARRLLGLRPTPLVDGLRRTVDALDEPARPGRLDSGATDG
jgi:UDP-glucose 4-epimerase